MPKNCQVFRHGILFIWTTMLFGFDHQLLNKRKKSTKQGAIFCM